MTDYLTRPLGKATVGISNMSSSSVSLISLRTFLGMTETATTLTFPRIDMKIGTLGSGGQLLAGNVARLLRPDGTWAGYNEPGELVVKGPSVALCYYNNEEA